ncbi:MAG: hypothetical protein Q9191_000291 [Dirinaria sp. TL-2023a]
MFASKLLTLAISAASVVGQTYQGFNYGSVFTDNSPITQSDYENQFNTAKRLVGTSGFTSARIYTMIQAGTTNSPSEAIPAAISTKTSLLLGLFLTTDQSAFNNELAALRSAITTYGQAFINLIAGISVGSEDLYRISPIGIENHSNPGVEPAQVADYISQVRAMIKGTAASSKPVGHVDTWTAWVNGSNDAVINAVDFLGVDAYPYFQNTMSNAIGSGNSLFYDAFHATQAAANGKPVWVTETGWPVSGPESNLAVASIANAKTYWDQVGCSLFGHTNTWWYTLQDAYPTTPSPSFGVVGTTLSTTPLYDLSCSKSSSSASTSASASASPSASKGSTTASTGDPAPPSESQPGSNPDSPASTESEGGKAQNPAQEQVSDKASGPSPHAAPSVKTLTVYTTFTTCPVTVTSGSETKTTVTTSAVAVTSSVGSTLAKVTKAASPTGQGPAPAQSQTAGSCPTALSGDYQYPHLIVKVDKSQPSTALGNGYTGHVSSTISSVFNFDIPPSYEGKTCSLVFLFPERDQLPTSNYTLSSTGGLDFARLKSPVTEQTTYSTVPAVEKDVGSVSDLQAGSGYAIASGACFAGARLSYEVSATGSLDLEYFQDYNAPAIGLYITAC